MNRILSALAPFVFTACLFAAPETAGGAPAPAKPATQIAVIGGGCFWCLDSVYRKVVGVVSVECGYAGGKTPNPDYKTVCEGDTGHAEVIRITYDPSKVTYAQLLEIFRDIHDPTTLNAQGPDHGTQYRSIILHADDKQKTDADAWRKEAATHFNSPVVTEIKPLATNTFHIAEEYHQDYFNRNPNQPYCAVIIPPKLNKLFKKHADKIAPPVEKN